MIAYSYNFETKEYTGEYRCQPDPLDGGFLLPAFATEIKPEQPKEGHVMVFKDEGWVEVKDHRGEVYNKETKQLSFWEDIGEFPPTLTKKIPKAFDKWDKEKNDWVGHEDFLKQKFEYESSYAYKRAKAYPPILDQLDALYWDKINGTNNWVESINKIKQEYPKED